MSLSPLWCFGIWRTSKIMDVLFKPGFVFYCLASFWNNIYPLTYWSCQWNSKLSSRELHLLKFVTVRLFSEISSRVRKILNTILSQHQARGRWLHLLQYLLLCNGWNVQVPSEVNVKICVSNVFVNWLNGPWFSFYRIINYSAMVSALTLHYNIVLCKMNTKS